MLNSKQRANLRSLAQKIDPVTQVGKFGVNDALIDSLDKAIEKRELIKVSVLKNCDDDPREIAAVIGERTHSEVIKVIGKKMIFFRQAKKNTKYNLPD